MNNRTSGSESQDVIVVGGGIGGLATAFSLRQQGLSVRLLERAPEFGEVGAGLQLSPNATRILDNWGLLDEVRAAGVEPKRLVLGDAITGEKLTHLPLGEEFQQHYGAPYVVVHRSDLHRILLEACREAGVELQTNSTVERVETGSDSARTYLSDGTALKSQVVIGADGLNSRLRSHVVDDEPVCSGYVAYRGAVPISERPDVDLDEVIAWMGPGCHFVHYGLRQGKMANLVAVFRSPKYFAGEADWGGPDELDTAFAQCCDRVRQGLDSLWRDRHWKMYDRIPISNWSNGRLMLVGDAAHATLQYLAQGACQSIEDAEVLGSQVGKHRDGESVEWEEVFSATQQIRAPQASKVQTTARTWGDIWHVDGLARSLRNELLATRSPNDYKHIDWLYGA